MSLFSQSSKEALLRTVLFVGSFLGALFLLPAVAFAASGDLVWVKQAGQLGDDFGFGITTDSAGNSYVTGTFFNSATFGPGETNEITLVGAGLDDIFIAKYDSNGLLEWAKQAGGTSDDQGLDIAVDTTGNSYVTGSFRDTATFGAGEANETALVSTSSTDIFIAKYDSNGLLEWAKQISGIGGYSGNGIAVDTAGNSYVTGTFFNSATFGAGEANETILVSAGHTDIFVAKYNSDGDLVWAKGVSGTGSGDSGNSIALDTTGNSYVTGSFRDTATFGAGEANEATLVSDGFDDIFIAKYDSSGDLTWVKRTGGISGDEGYGIATDSSGNSYVTGSFRDTATFGTGEANETTLVGGGFQNSFVAKYDPNGSLMWARRDGGTNSVRGKDIAIDTTGNSYVTGDFSGTGTVTFGAGEANETTLAGTGSQDLFVAEYDSNGELIWVKHVSGGYENVGFGIAVDDSGNSYVTGYFRDAATFGAGEANETTLLATGFGAPDILVAKFEGAANSPPVITLTGSSTIEVSEGDTFVDPGATASDAEDGDITASIVVGGDVVDENTSGTYVITYNVDDSEGLAATEVTRTVVVLPSGVTVGENPTIGEDVTLKDGVEIGDNVVIEDGATVGKDTSIGNDAMIGASSTIKKDVVVGDNLDLGDNAKIKAGSAIGDDATIGSGATIGKNISVGNGASVGENADIKNDVIAGDNLTLGDNSKIKSGATIGSDATVGASSTIGSNTTVGNGATVGNNATIKNDITAGDNLTLGDNSNIQANSVIGSDVSISANSTIKSNVTIEDNVTIGENVTIKSGALIQVGAVIENNVTIKKDAIVEAGCTVPSGTTVQNGETFSCS